MFIMTNIDVSNNLVSIFDTSDGVLDTVSLYPIASQVVQGRLNVAGMHSLQRATRGSVPVPNYNLAINMVEARKALAKDYVNRYKISQQEAYKRVGLI